MAGKDPPTTAYQVEHFFDKYPVRHYRKHTILIFAHEKPSAIYYLIEGSVRQYDISRKGDEAVVNVFTPPAFFPIDYAINRQPNEYFFDAVADLTVRLAPIDDVLRFIQESPAVVYDLLSRVYSGLDGTLRRQVYLMSGTTTNRLAYELVICYRRFGEPLPYGRCLIRLTEVELAARVGMTRETISRHLQQLKRLGIVHVVPTGIVIADIRSLEHLSSGDT